MKIYHILSFVYVEYDKKLTKSGKKVGTVANGAGISLLETGYDYCDASIKCIWQEL